jgi:hypothetical protein
MLCGLTFELSGAKRCGGGPGLAKMYKVPPTRAWRHAVGAPLERGVRRLSSGGLSLAPVTGTFRAHKKVSDQRYHEPESFRFRY